MTLADLSGKTIVITGASSGIGRSVAVLVSQLGGDAVLIARRQDQLEKTAELMTRTPAIYVYDLQDIDGIGPLIRRVICDLGAADGLVHCAGVLPIVGLRGITQSMAEKTMRINFYAFIELAKHLTAVGAYRSGMSLVGISSYGASRGAAGKTLYSASKAALEAAVRCLAVELAAKQIRVNCVAPGVVRTPLVADYVKQADSSEDIREALSRQYLGIGDPSDVASLVAFMLSSSSQFITGATLPVDGGKVSW